MPTTPAPRLTPRLAALRLGAPLGIACAIAGGLTALVALTMSPSFALPAALAVVPALIGVAIGIVLLAALLTNPNVEPGIAVLGASVVRILLAGLIAAGMQKTLLLEAKPFWYAFLAIYLAVIISEFILAHRLFNPNSVTATEAARQ